MYHSKIIVIVSWVLKYIIITTTKRFITINEIPWTVYSFCKSGIRNVIAIKIDCYLDIERIIIFGKRTIQKLFNVQGRTN